MNCSEIKAILDSLDDNSVPPHVHQRLDEHVDSCRACQAGMANFLKIGKILEKTVYGERGDDELLRYASHVIGRTLHWETPEEAERRKRRGNPIRLLIKIAAGFVLAAVVGGALALILGNLGVIGGNRGAAIPRRTADRSAAETSQLEAPMPPPQSIDPGGSGSELPVAVPEGGLNPESVFNYINVEPATGEAPEADSASLTPADSSRLRTLEAELDALRDALARDPSDTSLRRRMMEMYRQVIEERKRLRQMLRAQDYYNLGYMHYSLGEYPQTAVVTAEGLRMVRMGPTQYLHYLKAMSHYQIAMRASTPLPADSTADSAARVRGAQLRAELDREGRRRAVTELRKAITDFSYLLSSPELESIASEWVLRCNEQISTISSEE